MMEIMNKITVEATNSAKSKEKLVKRVSKEKEQKLGMRDATKEMISEILRPLFEAIKTKENTKDWDKIDSHFDRVVENIYTNM